ncbi:TonB-dependent receptor domain-containing protein [Novosphingobium cyanobacteriorum]|uniref:TonB-dependent receptor n=1 Tax=Novosphingobium cyanobacteriorum TaxID=3024215 RepID=A0ABT6CFT5_9SPHN|nr:TonB-dependent receptor [Novosphingobium cyanobacteriorum]MDF8332785.1 TonB-dependent receptor [Novosphingobium cyanobacteriorum]
MEHDDNATISTGVAKARDPLNSATSTSVVKEPDIRRLGPGNIAEVMRTLPGIRAEVDVNETGNSYTIRGLPLVGDGAKYLQLQEDGLPVLQFGDLTGLQVDMFLRNDLNLASVESIRGGSASTFASDAPGGVVNFISKTGDVEGGSIMASSGLDRGVKRIDADYGGHINADWRFHIGGFYRVGEGSRSIGFDGFRGGQVKFNITRQLANGYIRFSAKVLDDEILPPLGNVPLAVTGTDADPRYGDLPGFSAKNDSLYSRYIGRTQLFGPNNTIISQDFRDRMRIKSLALGLESQFEIGGWTVSDRFRHSRNSAKGGQAVPLLAMPAAFFVPVFGGGATASATYFSGPNAGQAVAPTDILALTINAAVDFHDVDLTVNDLRASRVYQTGGGELTLTGGLYAARQNIGLERSISALVQNVAGNGNSGLVNLINGGFPISQDGTFAFNALGPAGALLDFNVGHTVLAPYGSFNYKSGSVSIGGSVRYNTDRVRGSARADGAGDTRFVDIDGNGVPSSFAETVVTFIPAGVPDLVHYSVHSLSWSVGVNWRVMEDFSVFARYSKGARNGADRILTDSAINKVTGQLADPVVGTDHVRQAEAGFKFRRPGITFNATGFLARTSESNNQLITTGTQSSYILVQRSYKAYGAEFEANFRHGPWSLSSGATLTHAEITAAPGEVGLVGKTARHQPSLIFQLTPAYDSELFSVGASIVGTTGSYAQDVNLLRLPGYTTVGLFVRVRPVDRLELGLNASNLFDKLAVVNVLDGTMPATGITVGSTLAGRRATASVRLFF